MKMVTIIAEKNKDDLDQFRAKRQINSIPLVYPYGATYKLLIGMTTPVPDLNGINLVFAANFQYQYIQFQNITQLSQYYFINTVSREQRDADIKERRSERLAFYSAVEEMLNSKGFKGNECMLRAICEAAQYPVKEEGFIGEILHILLTPDYGRTPFDDVDEDWKRNMAIYVDAAVAGRQMFSCAHLYPGCPEGEGVLELVTLLSDE